MDIITVNNSNDEFSVEQLSAEVNMSRSNLFHKGPHQPNPYEFIYYLRLEQARNLLLERNLSLSLTTLEVTFIEYVGL